MPVLFESEDPWKKSVQLLGLYFNIFAQNISIRWIILQNNSTTVFHAQKIVRCRTAAFLIPTFLPNVNSSVMLMLQHPSA
jgi:hypothetical protein